ncbi:MAG: sulfite oxidase heme-binding subunit YedZ, partial [Vicinamibacterales bacterium]
MPQLIKPIVFVAALVPLASLIVAVLTGRTSANPAEDIILTTGIWALRFLLASLAITPIRRLTGWNVLIKYRRMLGLFAFFYASIHMLSYLAFDQLFALDEVVVDVAKRPFITAGMAAFLTMIPLAVTSTRGWIRRLGRRWQLLHRLVYVSACCASLHFVWKVKVAIGEPVYYAALVGLLLGFRLVWRLRPPAVSGVKRHKHKG